MIYLDKASNVEISIQFNSISLGLGFKRLPTYFEVTVHEPASYSKEAQDDRLSPEVSKMGK